MQETVIGSRVVGPGHPCFVIAEAGVNHNGRLDLARRLVEAAAEAGADAVKFQTFRAEWLVTPEAPKAPYQNETVGPTESQYDMLKRLELAPEAHRDLLALCGARGIQFLSTPFDAESADFLDALGVPAFKVGSGEITNLPLLAHLARKGKPVILSTGMARLGEVEQAVRTIEEAGNRELVLLHCVSNYPADPADANLRAMETLARAFDVPVGYSDHTRGIEVALAAVALGACVLEKHLTLDQDLPGPDHRSSVEPAELAQLVRGVRNVEQALGTGRKAPADAEAEVARAARRSLVLARDAKAGTALTEDLLAARRPGTGLPPTMLPQVLGHRLRRDLPAGTVLEFGMLD